MHALKDSVVYTKITLQQTPNLIGIITGMGWERGGLLGTTPYCSNVPSRFRAQPCSVDAYVRGRLRWCFGCTVANQTRCGGFFSHERKQERGLCESAHDRESGRLGMRSGKIGGGGMVVATVMVVEFVVAIGL